MLLSLMNRVMQKLLSECVVCYVGESTIPYKESTCHSTFIPKYSQSGCSPLPALIDEKCVGCEGQHYTCGCMQVKREFMEQENAISVDHDTSIISHCLPEDQHIRLSVKQHYQTLQQLLIKHSNKWTGIASHLGFRLSEIEVIQTKPLLMADAPASWLRTMLEQWLEWTPGDDRGSTSFPTLENLKDALIGVGLNDTARNLCLKIMQKHEFNID